MALRHMLQTKQINNSKKQMSQRSTLTTLGSFRLIFDHKMSIDEDILRTVVKATKVLPAKVWTDILWGENNFRQSICCYSTGNETSEV